VQIAVREDQSRMSAVVARQLVKHYPSEAGPVAALNGVDVSVAPGEFVAIMGPSGCGKSTLLNLIAGLDLPTSGTLEVNGVDLTRLSDTRLTEYRRRVVGVVFQFFNLLPTLTVEENISLPALLAGAPEKRALEKAAVLAARVGLAHRLRHGSHQLSGGEMQRAAIARALVNDPAVLLADEPTGNLDSRSSAEVLSLLKDLRRETGATVLLVTHSPEAASAADRIIRMVDGKVDGGAASP
jgi:putative ABC transport system ATP-binding protein